VLVNQRTHNPYIFKTVTFTLAHLNRKKAPANNSPNKGPKMKYG